MSKSPKLSILIPTYNREKYISQAIDSVLNQPFDDFEIICSDNASIDKTYEILKKYSEKDRRIKVFQNKENLGPVLNWKNCLDNASGEYIHWLWSDDWIESNFYQDAFDIMDKDSTSALSTWNYRSDNPLDTNDKYISWQFSFPKVPSKIAAKKVLMATRELPVSPAAYILPRGLVKENFYLNIPKLSDKLDPVNKGVGVDSLMIIGTCMQLDGLSILQKPSVIFRKHDNLSTQLGKDGSLGKMYFISHLWFLSNNNVKLSFKEVFKVYYRTLRTLRENIFSPKVLKILMILTFRIIRNIGKYKDEEHYDSNKAVFK